MEDLTTQEVLSTLGREGLPEEIADDVKRWKRLTKKLKQCLVLKDRPGKRTPAELDKMDNIPQLEMSIGVIEKRVQSVLHTKSGPATGTPAPSQAESGTQGSGRAAKKKRQKERKAREAAAAATAAAQAEERDRLVMQDGNWTTAGEGKEATPAPKNKKKKKKKQQQASTGQRDQLNQAGPGSEETKRAEEELQKQKQLSTLLQQQLSTKSAQEKKREKRQRQKKAKQKQQQLEQELRDGVAATAAAEKAMTEALQRIKLLEIESTKKDQAEKQQQADADAAYWAEEERALAAASLSSTAYRQTVACAPEDTTAPDVNLFVATREWQAIPDGMQVPPGLKIQLDMQSGISFAKLR